MQSSFFRCVRVCKQNRLPQRRDELNRRYTRVDRAVKKQVEHSIYCLSYCRLRVTHINCTYRNPTFPRQKSVYWAAAAIIAGEDDPRQNVRPTEST